MLRQILFAAVVLSAVCNASRAALIQVDFAGTITSNGTDSRFGVVLPSSSPITGRFYFDTASAGVEATNILSTNPLSTVYNVSVTRTHYRQSIANGLTFNIPGYLSGYTDSYVVSVANDVNVSSPSTFFDTLGVTYSTFVSSAFPASVIPTSDLYINGPAPVGSTFSLTFRANPPTLYSSMALPTNVTTNQFSARSGQLIDANLPVIALISNLTFTSTVVAPECGTTVSFAVAGCLLMLRRKGRRYRG